MDHTKIDKADLDSPRRELFNGGLWLVIALPFFRETILFVRALGAQSICTLFVEAVAFSGPGDAQEEGEGPEKIPTVTSYTTSVSGSWDIHSSIVSYLCYDHGWWRAGSWFPLISCVISRQLFEYVVFVVFLLLVVKLPKQVNIVPVLVLAATLILHRSCLSGTCKNQVRTKCEQV